MRPLPSGAVPDMIPTEVHVSLTPSLVHRREWPSSVRLVMTCGGVVALLAALLTVVARPAMAATIDTGAYYVLVNRHSGKAMDVWEWSTANGGEIRQYDNLGGYNQQFRFVPAGDGYYALVNRHSGKAVDVSGTLHRRWRRNPPVRTTTAGTTSSSGSSTPRAATSG